MAGDRQCANLPRLIADRLEVVNHGHSRVLPRPLSGVRQRARDAVEKVVLRSDTARDRQADPKWPRGKERPRLNRWHRVQGHRNGNSANHLVDLIATRIKIVDWVTFGIKILVQRKGVSVVAFERIDVPEAARAGVEVPRSIVVETQVGIVLLTRKEEFVRCYASGVD